VKRFVLTLLLTVSATVATPDYIRFEESLDSMGTTYSVVVYGKDRFQLQAAVQASLDEVRRLDSLLSNYKENSEWSQVNRFASERPVKVSQELFDLLGSCLRYSAESEGAFDVTVGPLMKVWGFYKGSGRFPHRAEVRGALTRVGYWHIKLDAANRTVSFDRSGVEIDPGGIGKGYAVDRVVALLKQEGIVSGLVTAGGSTIFGIGTPPDEPRGWRIEIRHPRNAAQSVQEVFLKNESMSTSGNYEKFFRVGRKMYSHIMDPRTGYPATGMLSVSVIAPKALDSEIWAKPFYIHGRKWAAIHKHRDFRVYLCEDLGENPCAWLQ
jgi:thiamine biosynthesis lipoprotein